MISGEISLDKLVWDMDQQIEVLSAIAADNAILNEQLRLLHEAREMLINQSLEMSRLVEMLDPDQDADFSTQMEGSAEQQDTD